MLASAVGAAIEGIRCLHAVTDDAAATMGTGGSQRVDGALKAVEYMSLAAHFHLETFVVNVAAHLTRRCLGSQYTFAFIHVRLFSMISCVERLGPSGCSRVVRVFEQRWVLHALAHSAGLWL